VPLAIAMAVFVPIVFAHGRAPKLLEMGDDAAIGIGVDVRRVRLILVLVSWPPPSSRPRSGGCCGAGPAAHVRRVSCTETSKVD